MLAGDVCARARPDPARRELTEAERATFWRQGFLTVPGLFTEAELQELDDHSAALADGSIRMEQPSGAAIDEHEFPEELDGPDSRASLEENRFFRYIQQHRNIPLHEHYLLHPRVLDVLEQLIGPDIMAMQSMLFLKPPQQPGQGYHQDSKYITTSPDLLCGAWIASKCPLPLRRPLRALPPAAPRSTASACC